MNEITPLPAGPPAAEDQPVAPLEPSGGILRLSPVNARRAANFRANKRGFWSLWIFLVIFVVTLFAEFIANDRPILVSYKGEWLYPVFVNYPEEKFGGFLPVTDYRDPVVAKEIAANGWAIWPPIHFSYDTHNLDLPTPAPSPPGWLLTTEQCRSLAVRLDRNKGRDPATLGC